MTYRFTIPGSLPGLNEYITAERTNKFKAAQMKSQAEAAIIHSIKSQLRSVSIKAPVTLHYRWIEKNRRRDLDNVCFAKKFVQDSLVKSGILENDNQSHVQGFSDDFGVDAKKPRIEVEIREVDT